MIARRSSRLGLGGLGVELGEGAEAEAAAITRVTKIRAAAW